MKILLPFTRLAFRRADLSPTGRSKEWGYSL